MPQSSIVTNKEASKRTISRLVQRGQLRHLGHGIYTKDVSSPEDHIGRREWIPIVEALYHQAVLTGQSAMYKAPDTEGRLYIESDTASTINVASLKIISKEGSTYSDDIPITSKISVASPGRAIALSLADPRQGSSLRPDQCAAWISRITRHADLASREALIAQAESVGGPGAAAAKAEIEKTHAQWQKRLSDTTIRARELGGTPYDNKRIRQYQALAAHLQTRQAHIDTPPTNIDISTRAFLEAYFSNYIEGTEFALPEAQKIIYTGIHPEDRHVDSHIVDSTFRLANDSYWSTKIPTNADEFIQDLMERHALLTEYDTSLSRPPGEFKIYPNTTAGGTIFVHPDEVEGTLREGWAFIDRMEDPLSRALMEKYVIISVHPFEDGNGRLSRLAMNAELDHAGYGRIVVPSALRYQYLEAVRAMEHEYPNDYVTVMLKAHRWTSEIDMSSIESAIHNIQTTRANDEYDPQALTLGNTLLLPSELPDLVTQCKKIVEATHQPCQLRSNHDGHCRSILPNNTKHLKRASL